MLFRHPQVSWSVLTCSVGQLILGCSALHDSGPQSGTAVALGLIMLTAYSWSVPAAVLKVGAQLLCPTQQAIRHAARLLLLWPLLYIAPRETSSEAESQHVFGHSLKEYESADKNSCFSSITEDKLPAWSLVTTTHTCRTTLIGIAPCPRPRLPTARHTSNPARISTHAHPNIRCATPAPTCHGPISFIPAARITHPARHPATHTRICLDSLHPRRYRGRLLASAASETGLWPPAAAAPGRLTLTPLLQQLQRQQQASCPPQSPPHTAPSTSAG